MVIGVGEVTAVDIGHRGNLVAVDDDPQGIMTADVRVAQFDAPAAHQRRRMLDDRLLQDLRQF